MKKRNAGSLLPGVLFFLSLFYAPLVEQVKAAANPAAKAKSVVANPAWEADWKKTLEAAKKEGKVYIYTVVSSETRGALTNAFTPKYGIQLAFITGRGDDLVAKLTAERRANIYMADFFIGGATTPTTTFKPRGFLAPLKPLLILPEVTDPKAWYGGALFFTDKERQYVPCPVLTAANSYLAVNTDLVKPGEIKTYKDLLNPKWHGKIIMNDPTIPGAGSRWFAVVADRYTGLDYMRELVKQEPTITRDQRLQVEGMARGKYPIAIGAQPDILADFIKASAHVDTVIPEEGTWLGGGPGLIVFFDHAPNPNAAKIFANWFLSKEGQTVYSKTARAESARLDVPTDHLDKGDLRMPGVKYFISEDEEFLIKKTEYEKKWAKDIFGSLIK